MAVVLALLLYTGATAQAGTPLTCQPNAEQPMLPTFHIIGNVTKNADNSIKLEPINDCSGVTYYEGIWHVWHQCCQSHWDHVISKDLVHWQRLPPPIQPVTTRTWDGSISMLPKEDGGPLILYDAEDGKLGPVHDTDGNPIGSGDRPILGVARLADLADKYLMTWTRVENNPVVFEGSPGAFPGQVWKNDDHWNFIMQGKRYQSNDSKFHTWDNMGTFNGQGEHGGQWWLPFPAQTDGTPAPVASTPNYIVNVGGGDKYLWGDYHAENESFVPFVPTGAKVAKTSELEGSLGGWWGAQAANGRVFMIGWALGDYNGPAGPGIDFLTRLTLLREVNYDAKLGDLVSNPAPELTELRTSSIASEKAIALMPGAPHQVAGTAGGAAASADIELRFTVPKIGTAQFGACVLAKQDSAAPFVPHWEIVPDSNAAYDMVGVPGNLATLLGNASTADGCWALCNATTTCQEFAWNIFGPHPPPAFLNSTLACYKINHPDTTTPFIKPQPGATSGKLLTSDNSRAGIGITITVSDQTVSASVAVCNTNASSVLNDGSDVVEAKTFPLFADEDVVTVRILPDRSVADFFVQGGRWAGTSSWISGAPRAPDASQVTLFTGTAGVTADVDVYGMGCGWEFPSYTENPTM